ncbi:protein kinase domain-containing protein [Gordonia sp. (in: high G+C Gram-positive bacteria)]|uniref:serine/threonine-protein kinase n=1 Tax=Gordonia sp. (in: high G+C Gram-positive bacteria) TaxID=84139 RepID=UPI003C78D8FD
MFQIGDDIAGYRVERVLGAGGMGEVYQAAHPRLPRSDAIKVLRSAHAEDPVVRQRFEREADLLAPIVHPNLVRIYDRGAFDDILWIAMELVAGTDAAKMSQSSAGGMDPRLVVNIVNGVAAGLDVAHRHGVLHRDVKPANILVTPGSDPIVPDAIKVTDFGIARTLGEAGADLTSTGTAVGTLRYSAPEQIEGREVDGRTDIYALAATTFELLTGTAPYESDTLQGLISAHLFSEPPRASERERRLPPAVDAVLAAGLSKDPAARPQTATAFAYSLYSAFTSGAPMLPAAQTFANTPGAPVSHPVHPAPVPAHRWYQKLSALVSIATVAGLALGVGGGYLWSSSMGLDAPSGVQATATPQGVDLTWDAVPGATNYVLKQDDEVVQTVDDTSLTLTEIFPGEHTFSVAAQNLADRQSDFSDAVSVTAVQNWGLMRDVAKAFPDLLPSTPVSTDGFDGLTCTAQGPVPDAGYPAAIINCKKKTSADSSEYEVRILRYASPAAASSDTYHRVNNRTSKKDDKVRSAQGSEGAITTGVADNGTARSLWEFKFTDPRAAILVEVVYPDSRDTKKARDLIGKLPF